MTTSPLFLYILLWNISEYNNYKEYYIGYYNEYTNHPDFKIQAFGCAFLKYSF